MGTRSEDRRRMVETQVEARGVRDRAVLTAMRAVPREAFLAPDLAEFAYRDTPLPIEAGQTISQPYMVALMSATLELKPGDRILEVGTGSGYAAAVLSSIAAEVFTIERHEDLADLAAKRLRTLGYANVHVRHGDGTLGLPEEAPFDAIVVAAGGPEAPPALLAQLADGGRLVIPLGSNPREQELVLIRRHGDSYARENLGGVRFVPLIGAGGWQAPAEVAPSSPQGATDAAVLTRLVREVAEPLDGIEHADVDALLDRIGDARVVLLGEATHGTSEFYRMRARITQELIRRRGFTVVAVEADWPDAASVDHFVRHSRAPAPPWKAFTRFPTWMWRNGEVENFVRWMRHHNEDLEPARRVGFHGLDLYSLYTSIAAVLRYLDGVDPAAARLARERYACLSPWQNDPAAYGRAVVTGAFQGCEEQVVAMLRDMLDKRLDYQSRDGERYLDALQNTRLVANAERYYRSMYYGSHESWNLRDQHMFETLQVLLAFRGPQTKAVIWEHNSHVGNAAATEMGARGEWNVGQLARGAFAEAAYLVGFGTDHGTVAAATDWDGPMELKQVRPAHPQSYERLCHDAAIPAFLLALRDPRRPEVRDELAPPRLERAIGVVYRPETELASHYFQASLPAQFDEYVWFDQTSAVASLAAPVIHGASETHPFAL